MKKVCILLAFFIHQVCHGQYLVSGYIDGDQQERTVYLSLLNYDEELMISFRQILFTATTDSTGYFEFEGQLLSEKDKLYRIHANPEEKETLQLVDMDGRTNYYNFIFSNRDTIYFPRVKDKWFADPSNSNRADLEWRGYKDFRGKLIDEYPRINHKEARRQVNLDYVGKIKSYIQTTLTHPLVKLLAFSDIKKSDFDLKTDFEKDTRFYNDIGKVLKNYYDETSYYLQYQEELSKISNSILSRKYEFYRNMSYVLVVLVFLLLTISVILLRIVRLEKRKNWISKFLLLPTRKKK